MCSVERSGPTMLKTSEIWYLMQYMSETTLQQYNLEHPSKMVLFWNSLTFHNIPKDFITIFNFPSLQHAFWYSETEKTYCRQIKTNTAPSQQWNIPNYHPPPATTSTLFSFTFFSSSVFCSLCINTSLSPLIHPKSPNVSFICPRQAWLALIDTWDS